MAENIEIKKVDGKSLDIEAVDKEKLKAVFPQCFSEGKLDIDKLLSLCGEYIDNDFEKYKFEWKGKSECYKIAGKRSTGTLRPCVQESVDFENTNNLYIEGDNLEVLKLLQNAYYRKVKMIYIDPPYNTGNDFVYEDDFKDPLAKYKEITSQTTKSNPETMGRYHTNWLNMMYPRLRLAANLLRDDGIICVSIDDHEIHNLKKICDEVFGEENFEGHIHWRRRHNQPNDKTKMIGLVAEHIIVYAKNSEMLKKAGVGKIDLTGSFSNPDNDPRGEWASKPWKVGSDQSGSRYLIQTPTGQILNEEWMGDESTYKSLLADNRIVFPRGGDGMPRKKYFKYEREEEGQCATNWWESSIFGNNQGANDCMTNLFGVKNVFSNPKPVELIRGLIQISNAKNNDIILDFFSGSATTAHSVMQINSELDENNLQYILVQLPENLDKNYEASSGKTKAQIKVAIDFLDSIEKKHFLSEIGKERIRRAGTKIKAEYPEVDTGFKVFKLDTSNLVKWDDTPILDNNTQDLFTRMNNMVESIKTDRTELDVVYEVMLKLGIPVTYKIFETQVNGRKVYSIGEDGLVLVCLDKSNGGITPEDITAMCDLAPAKIVAAENAFKDDVALSNAYYISKDKGIEIELL